VVRHFLQLFFETGLDHFKTGSHLLQEFQTYLFNFFIHPLSTHGVVCEFVSVWNFPRDKSGEAYMVFDWSDSKVFMVSPDVNEKH
jgi:hypothetical protein